MGRNTYRASIARAVKKTNLFAKQAAAPRTLSILLILEAALRRRFLSADITVFPIKRITLAFCKNVFKLASKANVIDFDQNFKTLLPNVFKF